MQEHIQIYKELFERLDLKQKVIASQLGWTESKMSRFLSGNDIKAGEFFHVLSAMPTSFQRQFWKRFLNFDSDIDVSSLSSEEAANLLYALGDRLQLLESSKRRVTVG